MLYDPGQNFIFVHIWKTGGESVVSALRAQCPAYFSNRYLNKAIRVLPASTDRWLGWRAQLVRGQHMTAADIADVMPAERFARAVKFTFVRNPWDWQVSAYNYALQTPAHSHHEEISSLGSFEAFLDYQYAREAPDQTSFILGPDGENLVDFIGRFETLQDDFARLCDRLGVKAQLPHLNASQRSRDWKGYYTDTSKALVADLFKRDIAQFGYRWD